MKKSQMIDKMIEAINDKWDIPWDEFSGHRFRTPGTSHRKQLSIFDAMPGTGVATRIFDDAPGWFKGRPPGHFGSRSR